MDELIEGVTVDGEVPVLDGARLITSRGMVGEIEPEERRIAYVRPLPPELARRVEVERRLFDVRALLLETRLRRSAPVASAAAWLDSRRVDNHRLTEVAGRLPSLEGARVLELGGSGEATRGFLQAGVRRVDQLDVSAGMLRVARARLDAEEQTRVVQHLTFAERLPFADRTFDLVFTRHCLHHMDRAAVLPEVSRVIQKNGAFLVIEPYLPSLIKVATRARRRLVRAERGTDDPLEPRDLAAIEARFEHVVVGGEPALATLLRAGGPRLRRRAHQLDQRLPGSATRWIGGRLFLLAQRPR